MYTKIEIKGFIEVLTGLHIGGSSQFSAIGAIDSPVVRDVYSSRPMIPGSSLKGKMRSLLAYQYNDSTCLARTPDDDDIRILRLFGSSASAKEQYKARLLFSDLFISNMQELREKGIDDVAEIKFENTIDRLTATAKPRQIERVIRGSRYALSLIYSADSEKELEEDFQSIAEAMKLLRYDYLGGHGSRGYGKVTFTELAVKQVMGQLDDATMKKLLELLEEACK